jgi:hypothetical protein
VSASKRAGPTVKLVLGIKRISTHSCTLHVLGICLSVTAVLQAGVGSPMDGVHGVIAGYAAGLSAFHSQHVALDACCLYDASQEYQVCSCAMHAGQVQSCQTNWDMQYSLK